MKTCNRPPETGTYWLTSFDLYDGGQDDDTLRPVGFSREWEVCAPDEAAALAVAKRVYVEPLGADVLREEVEPAYQAAWGEGSVTCVR